MRRFILIIGCVLAFAGGTTRCSARTTVKLKEFLPSGTSPGDASTAVIVCPGGSYFWLAGTTEGDSVARSLQAKGIAAYVLRYRTAGFVPFITHSRLLVPGHQHPMPLDDLQQAIRQVRAAGYRRVGVMGFSAGGHLVLSSAIFGRDSLQPDFVAAAYPVVTMSPPYVHKRSRRGLLGEWRKQSKQLCDSLSLERHVTAGMPPVLLVSCADDPVVDPHNALLMDSALTVHGVTHRHLRYRTGGHGFGTTWSKTTPEASYWFDEFIAWLHQLVNSK